MPQDESPGRIDDADPSGWRSVQSQALRGVEGRGAAAKLFPAAREPTFLDANALTNFRRPASTTALVLPKGRLAQDSLPR